MSQEHVALGAYLKTRRPAIMQAWRKAVMSDPDLTTGSSLPRSQLHDHLPALLADFEDGLMEGRLGKSGETSRFQKADAAAHGLHRWQQGFNLGEVTRELGRLNECVVRELNAYASLHPGMEAGAVAAAHEIWAEQCGISVAASVSQYFKLQQVEAAGQIRDLEQAMMSLRELEAERGRLWQQAAHDLRGGLGVVANASTVLSSPRTPEALRNDFLRLLDRNVISLTQLLNDVTSLARLQGGLEERKLASMDGGHLMSTLCQDLQPHALQKNLYLRFEGSDAIPVHGDWVKTRRIAQNLVLNAIKYTHTGGVVVNCGNCGPADLERWFIEVRDTGPGFHAGPGTPLVGALEEATEQSEQLSADQAAGVVSHVGMQSAGHTEDSRPVWQQPGEGIGLSIVKRLCDLLDATTELRSEIGHGTTFRILLPRSYEVVA